MKIVLSMPVFGKNLRYLRQKHGLPRFVLAYRLGLRWRDLRVLENPNWPTRGIDLDPAVFFRIGEVFEVDPNLLSATDLTTQT